MNVLLHLYKKHTYNVISTSVLLLAAVPVFPVSLASYLLLLAIIGIRGGLLYTALAYAMSENQQVCATQIIENNTFRRALISEILTTQSVRVMS